jgi:hypothetical protein
MSPDDIPPPPDHLLGRVLRVADAYALAAAGKRLGEKLFIASAGERVSEAWRDEAAKAVVAVAEEIIADAGFEADADIVRGLIVHMMRHTYDELARRDMMSRAPEWRTFRTRRRSSSSSCSTTARCSSGPMRPGRSRPWWGRISSPPRIAGTVGCSSPLRGREALRSPGARIGVRRDGNASRLRRRRPDPGSIGESCAPKPPCYHPHHVGEPARDLPKPRTEKVKLMAGERELTTGLLSKDASFRLIVNGHIGVKEIERLIAKLQFDKEIFAAEEASETDEAAD